MKSGAENRKSEAENLLALIFQANGEIKIEAGKIWIRPQELARQLADQVARCRKDLLVTWGYCPVCATELTVKLESLPVYSEQLVTGRKHTYCPSMPGHYDRWEKA
jgi:hypothetical protein